jgi:ABC-2 type transport system permease protein
MKVFKLFFRIILANLPNISIYLVVFSIMALIFASTGPADVPTSFESSQIRMAVYNDDADSALSWGFQKYLAQNTQPVSLPNDDAVMQDALFFREAEYILTIPEGFAASLLQGEGGEKALLKSSVPGSMSDVQAEFLISRYINLAKTYALALPGMDQQKMAESLSADLEQKSHVQLVSGSVSSEKQRIVHFFNYLPYPLMSIMILSITSVMLSLGQRDIRRRNAAAPMRNVSMNLQLVAGSAVFALAVWALLLLLGALMYADEFNPQLFWLLALNALVHTAVCLSLSFFLGYLVKSRNAQAVVSNVVSLGLCFISGVFVPQDLLGPTVHNIASFTPTYWYVKVVGWLDPSVFAGSATLTQILYAILIQLGFAAAFLSIALALSRQRSLLGR